MDQKSYWKNILQGYSEKSWSKDPNLFAMEVTSYFPKTGKILELAAGLGQDSKYFSALGYDVTSTDLVSTDQIVDLNNPLPFGSNSFDVVYCHLGLHYFPLERTKVLFFQEIYNVLKPNGVFCSIFNSLTDPEVYELEEIDTDFFKTPSGITKRYFSPDTLSPLLPLDFKIILLDNNGRTVKDKDTRLIRLICQKKI